MSKICPRCSALCPDDAGFCPLDGAELPKSSDRLLGRTIAARYRLTKKLGSGGMSVVYLARHELISRLNAIKILRPELSRIPEHRERFLREARAVNRINHENIVEITDVGESDGIPYLVMEYVEGESLLERIHDGPLGWERASRIAVQVASALARTHQTGIIHRDLKPENILLVPRALRPPRRAGGDGVADGHELVKLTDFGIAKMMGEPTLTLNEQLFGTPGYIAPEYVGGLPIDGRADIYSLAVVLYEMVTGRLPFEGRGQSDLLLKPLTSAPIPPGQRVRGLPPDFESLLLRCLARDPGERPHDAFALQDALVDVLRRHGDGASAEPAVGVPAVEAREPLATRVDLQSQAPRDGAVESAMADASSRWPIALAELETRIAAARRAGGAPVAVARASELASVAAAMVPRIERAAIVVSDSQTKVDRFDAVGREFRSDLGHAIDVLVHDRSRERAHLDALRGRREALERMPSNQESASWELDALSREERRAEAVVADLGFQIETLQSQLDRKNEDLERALVEVTGTLEGSLSALRRLANEIARTIDDGIDMLAQG